MAKTTLTFDAWRCERCNNVWKPKTDEKPLRCPDCGSCLWDRPKKDTNDNHK